MITRGVLFFAALMGCAAAAAQPANGAEREAGRRLFMSSTVPSCATCHTLRDAGATGEIGPVLDEIQPDEARVAKAIQDGLGVMPAFRDKLSAQDIALLARYVSKASRAKP